MHVTETAENEATAEGLLEPYVVGCAPCMWCVAFAASKILSLTFDKLIIMCLFKFNLCGVLWASEPWMSFHLPTALGEVSVSLGLSPALEKLRYRDPLSAALPQPGNKEAIWADYSLFSYCSNTLGVLFAFEFFFLFSSVVQRCSLGSILEVTNHIPEVQSPGICISTSILDD